MDVVHADDASDVIFMGARSRWILRQLCPAQNAGRRVSVVFVGVWVHSQALGNEPACTVRLLPLDDKELQRHE